VSSADGQIGAASVAFAERLHRRFLRDRGSVPEAWRRVVAAVVDDLLAADLGVELWDVLQRLDRRLDEERRDAERDAVAPERLLLEA